MSNINRCQNCCCIIRIYIADELRFHLEFIISLCPVLKSKIHGSRSKVTSADTDLNNCSEFLTCSVCDLTCMNFIGKICDLLLLLYIESTFINTISLYLVSKLATCHMMKNKTFLSCIDHLSIVKSLKLLCKLCFFCQLLQCFQHLVIHCFCSIMISQSCSHGNAVFLHTLCAALTLHHICNINLRSL